MPEGEAIVASGLVKRYRDGKLALDGFDLGVPAGSLFGLLGPNGAGKSTAVQIFTTLLAPTAGSARVAGLDVVSAQAEVRRVIGVALQETGVDPLLSGWEALELQHRLYGNGAAAARRRARELAEMLQLGEFAGRRIGTYSGGMRRRLDLALALVHRPAVLFLDEPTTGLDPESRFALWDLVRETREELGCTVLLTTQYLEEADTLCDRVAILRQGRVVAEDAPARLKRRLRRDLVRLEPEDATRLGVLLQAAREVCPQAEVEGAAVVVAVPTAVDWIGPLLAAAARSSTPLAGLRVTPPTLDEVFLDLTRQDSFVGAGE